MQNEVQNRLTFIADAVTAMRDDINNKEEARLSNTDGLMTVVSTYRQEFIPYELKAIALRGPVYAEVKLLNYPGSGINYKRYQVTFKPEPGASSLSTAITRYGVYSRGSETINWYDSADFPELNSPIYVAIGEDTIILFEAGDSSAAGDPITIQFDSNNEEVVFIQNGHIIAEPSVIPPMQQLTMAPATIDADEVQVMYQSQNGAQYTIAQPGHYRDYTNGTLSAEIDYDGTNYTIINKL